MDLGHSGETRSFTGPSVSPLLGANGAQMVELSLVAEAARHEVGQPFPSAERVGWDKGGFLRAVRRGYWQSSSWASGATRLLVEFVVGEQRGDVGGCLFREASVVEDLWGEGARAVVWHELGEVVGNGGCLDAQVAEHGIREPAAEELDGVAVDASAKESGGTARAERAHR